MKIQKNDADKIKNLLKKNFKYESAYDGKFIFDKIDNLDLEGIEVGDLFGGGRKNMLVPSELKKGDVFLDLVGTKFRPGVVIEVKDDLVIFMALSSTENIHNLVQGNCRFYGDNWFSKGLNVTSVEWVKTSLCGIYTDRRSLNKAIKMNKEFLGLINEK